MKNTSVFNAWVAAYTFLMMMLVKAGFEPFACTTVMDVPMLDAQREIVCYQGDWIVIATLAIFTLVLYGMIVPFVLFRSLLKMKVSHFGDKSRRMVLKLFRRALLCFI